MGWKGNLRTGIAIVRQIERAEERRASNAAKQYKIMLKQEAFENGQKAVEEYDNYIELISSTHKEASEQISWEEILIEEEPVKPQLFNRKQKEAEANLANYKPTFLDKIFGLTNKKVKKLESLLGMGRNEDEREYKRLMTHLDDTLRLLSTAYSLKQILQHQKINFRRMALELGQFERRQFLMIAKPVFPANDVAFDANTVFYSK